MIDLKKLRKKLNKKAGVEVAYDLSKSDVLKQKIWIPSGSKWFDGIVCEGKWAGWPGGKIIELVGLPGVGKSFLASIAMNNAREQGYTPVLFDPEHSYSDEFLEKIGFDLDELIYIQPRNVEEVFELVETILAEGDRFFIVWDSLAITPSLEDQEKDFNPQGSMMSKPRVISRGMEKLIHPIAKTESLFLVLNQPYTVPVKNQYNPPEKSFRIGDHSYTRSGGSKFLHAISLSVLLKRVRKKDASVYNKQGEKIGVQASLEILKSRFGSEGRKSNVKLLWGGGEVRLMDEEMWLDAIYPSDRLVNKVGRLTLTMPDGKEHKFTKKSFMTKLNLDQSFKNAVIDTMEHELIFKFANKSLDVADDEDDDGPADREES